MSRTPFSRWSAGAVVVGVAVAVAPPLVAKAGFGVFGSRAAPPAPRVSSAPLRPTISTRATIAFDRSSGPTYDCSLDGSTYLPCRNPVTFAGLNRARHVFGVRARNSTGGASSASTYRWTVVPPQRRLHASNGRRPLMTTAPVQPWISRNATFAWLQQRLTTSECRLDAGAWEPCSNQKTYLGLQLGPHVFRVRTKRASGRRSRVNRFSWTIVSASAAAAPTITSSPDEDTTSTDSVFSFDVAAGSGFRCRLDHSGWRQCSNPAIYVGLGTGAHTFCVQAIRPSGVVGPETCVTWTVHSPASPPEPSGAFTISGSLPTLLSPGAGGPLPLTVSNPFGFDLRVTALAVTVGPGSSQTGCDGPANLQVTQSNAAGGSVSIVVPAHGSVTLPAQGATAPQVSMLDLASNQDACKNAVFTFSYSGTGTRA
jgi:hypothetical protein